ncbi:MAG TPA: glycosyltransferase family 39 protein [Myxococcota bacterium]|nr:glycosyltransferase family 39 protein [Myxococcota bacterium]
MSTRRGAWAVFGIALALRLVQVAQVVAHDPFYDHPSVDSLIYVDWAKRIAAGDWLGHEAFFLSPLYGYLLGAVYALLGPSFLSPLLVNALLGAGTCALTYLLAGQLFDLRVALCAGLLASCYRMEIFYAGAPLLEPLQTFLCAAFTWAALSALARPSAGRFALAGGLTGLAVLGRQNLLVFALPFALWIPLALRGRESMARSARLAGAYLGATLLAIAPATLHNALAADDFVLVNSTGGIVLYTGWNPEANGVYMVPSLFPRALADDPIEQKDAYRALAEQRQGRSLRASEVSSYWRGQALAWAVANPERALALGLWKARLFFSAFEAWDVRSETLARPTSKLLRFPLVSFGVLGPLAFAGIALTAARWRQLVPLYLALATHFATFVVFIALSRYRVPALSALAVFGGVTPVALFEALRQRRTGRAALGAGVLAVALFAVNFHVPAEDLTMAHFNLGNAYDQQQDLPNAIAEYSTALRGAPTYLSGWNNLAFAYERSGADRELQRQTWKRVLELARAQGSARHVERATRHLAALAPPPPPLPVPQ